MGARMRVDWFSWAQPPRQQAVRTSIVSHWSRWYRPWPPRTDGAPTSCPRSTAVVRSISPPGAATARCVRLALCGSFGTATPCTSDPSTRRQPPWYRGVQTCHEDELSAGRLL